MTPQQRIKWLILEKGRSWGGELPTVTAENIDALYDEREEDWQDARDEVRCSGIETGIESKQWSRHYECEEVATQCPDGKWVGWTYWHGGGKHGVPSEVEWIDDFTSYSPWFTERAGRESCGTLGFVECVLGAMVAANTATITTTAISAMAAMGKVKRRHL